MVESSNNNEFRFKCGRMDVIEGKVKPIPDKGYVKIYKNEDSLICWEWYDLNTNKTSQDEPFVIFEDNWQWEKVSSGKGTVYKLTSTEYEEAYFYWIQEPKNEEKYKQIEERVKRILKTGSLTEQSTNIKNDNIDTNTNNNSNKTNGNNKSSNTQYIMDQISNALKGSGNGNSCKLIFRIKLMLI